MSTKSVNSFLGEGEGKFHMKFTHPPSMSIIFAVFMAQVSKLFWENKSKFVVQKNKFGWKKPKMTKIFGFEIWKRVKKGQFLAIFGISFFFHNLLRFSRAIFFCHFCFFFEKNYFWLVVVLDFWLNILSTITSEFMSLYAINTTNRKPLNSPISSTLS